jgi:hypothetical protein
MTHRSSELGAITEPNFHPPLNTMMSMLPSLL